MPWEAIMPPRSSGLVSVRTRMTRSPRSAHSAASLEFSTIRPTAAPGLAATALVRRVTSPDLSKRGNMSSDSCWPVTRVSASSSSMTPSSTSWQAILNAASAVRLPIRVCSIHSLPRWMVNSMSHRSL